MRSELIFRISGLTKKYGTETVIDGLSIEVFQGERIGIFAPSGAGKTTLVRIFTGLEIADGGQMDWFGSCPETIFQEPRLFPFLTVEENIWLPFTARKKKISHDTRRLYSQWLEVCGLNPYIKHYPYQISGGMKQKVALIRGLLGRPDFVIMDEPFQSIDVSSKRTIVQFILETCPGSTLLLITHDEEELPLLVEKVLFFQKTQLSQPVEISTKGFFADATRPNPFSRSFQKHDKPTQNTPSTSFIRNLEAQ